MSSPTWDPILEQIFSGEIQISTAMQVLTSNVDPSTTTSDILQQIQIKECEKSEPQNEEDKETIDLTGENEEETVGIHGEKKEISDDEDKGDKKKAEKIAKTRIEAMNQMLPVMDKKKEDSLRQRVDLMIEMTQSIDQQAEFTKKVLAEVGFFASKEVVASRQEEKDNECRQEIKKLSQLFQERAQIKQMAEDNMNLQQEMDQIKAEVMESKEIALQLEAEAEEVMSHIREVRLKESKKMGLVSQEEKPAVNYDRNYQRGGAQEDVNTPQFQSATLVARKFVFKRK